MFFWRCGRLGGITCALLLCQGAKLSVALGSGSTITFCQSRLLLVVQPYNWSMLLVIRLPRRLSYTSISTHLSLSGLLDSDVQDFDTMQAKLPTIAPWSH